MPLYLYKARNEVGKIVEGFIDVPDENAAALQLAERGLFATEIKIQKEKKVRTGFFTKGVRIEDIIIFSQQLATMYRAGLTIPRSLNILLNQTESKRLKTILNQVYTDVSGGLTLAQALAKHPTVFSEVYTSTIRVGEESGQLDIVLNSISAYLSRHAELVAKIKSALSYPIVILSLSLMVIIFILTFVLPKFNELFKGSNIPLPLPTRIMLALSDKITSYWYLIAAFIIGIIIMLVGLSRTTRGKRLLDRWKLHFPLIGPLILKSAIIRFTRPLAILVRTGVNIITSWEIVSKAVGNSILSDVLKRVNENIMKGGTITEPLKASGEFPPMVCQMISIGEESGSLDTMLEALSENYERQLDYSSKRLVIFIEPILLVFLAGVIGLLLLSVYLPLFSMMKRFG